MTKNEVKIGGGLHREVTTRSSKFASTPRADTAGGRRRTSSLARRSVSSRPPGCGRPLAARLPATTANKSKGDKKAKTGPDAQPAQTSASTGEDVATAASTPQRSTSPSERGPPKEPKEKRASGPGCRRQGPGRSRANR